MSLVVVHIAPWSLVQVTRPELTFTTCSCTIVPSEEYTKVSPIAYIGNGAGSNFTFGSVRIPTFSPSLTRLNPPSFSVNPDTVVEANFDRLKSSLEHPDNSEAAISVPTKPRKDAICKTSTNASKK